MTTKKMFYIMLSAVTGSVVGIVALIYFGNVILTKQSNKLIDTKAINLSLDKQETSLIKAKKDINKYQNLEEITQAIVPTDKDQARAAREIITIAQNNGFKLKTITFPASNLGSKPAKSNTPTPTDTKTETQDQPKTETQNPISQAIPVKDIKGVYSLEITIAPEQNISYYQFIDFLTDLEKNRRTAQVTSVKIEPKSSVLSNPQLNFSLTLNIFLKP